MQVVNIKNKFWQFEKILGAAIFRRKISKFQSQMVQISFVLALLSACSTSPLISDTSVEEVEEFTLTYAHYTWDDEKLENIRPYEDIAFLFPTVPGAIFGDPVDDILHKVIVSPKQSFLLSLPSNPLKSARKFEQGKLSITPKSTKVIRLGTFHIYADYELWGGGGFKQKSSGDSILLVYFSNEATLSGQAVEGREVFDFNFQIPNRGWYWLRFIERQKGFYSLTLYDGLESDIEFAVFHEDVTSL